MTLTFENKKRTIGPWTAEIASPTTPSSLSESLAASARRGSYRLARRNSGRRSAFATSRNAFPTTAFGGPRRSKRGVSACGVYLPDLEPPRRRMRRPGRSSSGLSRRLSEILSRVVDPPAFQSRQAGFRPARLPAGYGARARFRRRALEPSGRASTSS
jgi:hypothetical protein